MDIALAWTPAAGRADLSLTDDGRDLATDDGLTTAVLLSLFTDARARDDDTLPAGESRRGWWGDAVPPLVDGTPLTGDRLGSRLWLLRREKITAATLRKAETYCREALAWMLRPEVAIARSVEVVASRLDTDSIGAAVTITRPDGTVASWRLDALWKSTVK